MRRAASGIIRSARYSAEETGLASVYGTTPSAAHGRRRAVRPSRARGGASDPATPGDRAHDQSGERPPGVGAHQRSRPRRSRPGRRGDSADSGIAGVPALRRRPRAARGVARWKATPLSMPWAARPRSGSSSRRPRAARCKRPNLPPPGGVRASAPPADRVVGAAPRSRRVRRLRRSGLPERVTQTTPEPGSLWIRDGQFQPVRVRRPAARAGRRAGARDRAASRTGRETIYSVRIGPFAGTAQADAALAQVIRAGVTDARIVVE